MDQPIKIAVIGGTGKAGKHLVKELINQGYSIKVLLRNPDKLDIESPLMEKIKGDARNYDSVYSLVDGSSALISTLGGTKADEPSYSLATGHIIMAMNALHIRRYIMLTGMSIDAPGDKKSIFSKFLSWMMRLNFRAVIADKQKELGLLLGSDLDWTVVRVPMIEQTDVTRPIKTSLTDCLGNKISTADLAKFLIGQLADNQFFGKAPFLSS